MRPIIFVEGNVAFFDGFFFALYLIFTIDTLSLSLGVVGVLIVMGGIGALMGALIAGGRAGDGARCPDGDLDRRAGLLAPMIFALSPIRTLQRMPITG